MFQEGNLNITSPLMPVSSQASMDSLNNPTDSYTLQASQDSLNDLRQIYTFSFQTSKDSLNFASQIHPYSTQEGKKILSRFFTEKGSVHLKDIKRSNDYLVPLWIHVSFVFWLAVVLFIRQSYTYRLNQIFTSTFNQIQAKQFQREGNFLNQGFPILLLILYAFTISLFAFKAINLLFPNSFYYSFLGGFLILFGSVVLLQFAKFLIIWLIGFLFETRQISFQYLFEHYIFQISEGIILFPLLILYIYSGIQFILYVAAIVLLSLWAYRLLRSIIIGLDCTNFSRSYLFLYLCTLEVLPFLLLYKLSLQFV